MRCYAEVTIIHIATIVNWNGNSKLYNVENIVHTQKVPCAASSSKWASSGESFQATHMAKHWPESWERAVKPGGFRELLVLWRSCFLPWLLNKREGSSLVMVQNFCQYASVRFCGLCSWSCRLMVLESNRENWVKKTFYWCFEVNQGQRR